MLVYLKQDMGYMTLDGRRIYGRKFARGTFGSTDISVSMYKKHKVLLDEGEYTRQYMETKYGNNCPLDEFMLKNLRHLDFKTLGNLALYVGIKYHKTRWPTNKEKLALCRSIASFIRKTP